MKAGELFFVAVGDCGALADNLSYALDLPVVDTSGIDGNYSFYLPWNKATSAPAEFIEAMKVKYGVTLVRTDREVELLTIGKRTPDK